MRLKEVSSFSCAFVRVTHAQCKTERSTSMALWLLWLCLHYTRHEKRVTHAQCETEGSTSMALWLCLHYIGYEKMIQC